MNKALISGEEAPLTNLDKLSLNDIYKLDHKDLEKQVFEIDYSVGTAGAV